MEKNWPFSQIPKIWSNFGLFTKVDQLICLHSEKPKSFYSIYVNSPAVTISDNLAAKKLLFVYHPHSFQVTLCKSAV